MNKIFLCIRVLSMDASCDSGAQAILIKATALARVLSGHCLRTHATQIANHPEQ